MQSCGRSGCVLVCFGLVAVGNAAKTCYASQPMKPKVPSITRRAFVKSVAAAGTGLAVGLGALARNSAPAPNRRNIKLGLDNFSVRALGWKTPRLIDYAAELKTDSLFITDLYAFEKFDEEYLGTCGKGRRIKGSRSISVPGAFARRRKRSKKTGAQPKNISGWAFGWRRRWGRRCFESFLGRAKIA